MVKLFLASIAARTLNKAVSLFPNKPREQTKVAFIPTPADPYEDKWFVQKDRDKLVEMGFDVFDLDIKDKAKEELEESLKDVDIIFVAGGNTYYLLDKARRSGFIDLVRELVSKQGVLFIGSSAGAVFAGPDISPIELLDDLSKAPDLQSTEALNLVDFVVLPHYGEEKYKAKYQEILNKHKDKFKLITLTNDQAIIVEGQNHSIV